YKLLASALHALPRGCTCDPEQDGIAGEPLVDRCWPGASSSEASGHDCPCPRPSDGAKRCSPKVDRRGQVHGHLDRVLELDVPAEPRLFEDPPEGSDPELCPCRI